VQDQGAGGYALTLPLNSAVPTGTWLVRAFADPKGASVGQTTFMVEDYVPDRIEFSVTPVAKEISADKPAELKIDGRFLYGAPASALSLEGDIDVSVAKERPGYAGYRFGVANEEDNAEHERQSLEDLAETDADGKAMVKVALPKAPSSSRLYAADIYIRMVEAGGRAVERQVTLPVQPSSSMIGIKPLFGEKSVDEGGKAEFDVIFVAADGKQLPLNGARYELLRVDSRYQWFRRGNSWEYEPVKSTRRISNGDVTVAPGKPARISVSPEPGRYRLEVKSADANGPVSTVNFDVGWYSDGSADTDRKSVV
jgi:uncharacterized protein YfaS (alpha-2-macroglobulin family)